MSQQDWSKNKLGSVLIFQLVSRRQSPLLKASHSNRACTHLHVIWWLFRNLPVGVKLLIICAVTPRMQSASERNHVQHIACRVLTFSQLGQTGPVWLPLLTERFCKAEIWRTITGRRPGQSKHLPTPGNSAFGHLQEQKMTHQDQDYIEKQSLILCVFLLF